MLSILPCQFFSGVVINNANLKTDSYSPERYQKGKTNPNAPNANIPGGYDDSNITNEVHKKINKIVKVGSYKDPDSEPFSPCATYVIEYKNCLASDGMSDDDIDACGDCLDEALNDISDETMCDELKEDGYCDDVVSCEDTECNNECTEQIERAQGCILHYAGCTHYQFATECINGM